MKLVRLDSSKEWVSDNYLSVNEDKIGLNLQAMALGERGIYTIRVDSETDDKGLQRYSVQKGEKYNRFGKNILSFKNTSLNSDNYNENMEKVFNQLTNKVSGITDFIILNGEAIFRVD